MPTVSRSRNDSRPGVRSNPAKRSAGPEPGYSRDAQLGLASLRGRAGSPDCGRLLSRVRACSEGRELLAERPRVDGGSCSLHDLGRLPRGTFGREYAEWMSGNGFDPDDELVPTAREESGRVDPDAAYLRERLLEVHDLWHVLTGYNCDEDGELGLLAFSLGQTHSREVAAHLRDVVRRELRFAWRTGDDEWPHRLGYLYHAWRRGRRARFLVPVELETYFILPLDSVRQRLGIEPAAESYSRHSLPPIAVPA